MFPFLLILMLLFSISPSLPLLLYSLFVILLTLGPFAHLFICVRSLALGWRGSPHWRPLRVVGTLDQVIVGIVVHDGSAMSLRWWEMERWGTCVTWHGHSFPKCRGLPVGMFKWDGWSGSRRTAETCSWEHVSANRGDRLGQQAAEPTLRGWGQ